jgi:hypothetical protein
VGRLDDVIVDADDQRDLVHRPSRDSLREHWDLTGRQIVPTTPISGPDPATGR